MQLIKNSEIKFVTDEKGNPCFTAFFIGSKRSGKTTLLKKLLYEQLIKKFDFFLFICPYQSFIQYKDILSTINTEKKFSHLPSFKPEAIDYIMKAHTVINGNLHSLVVFDDCAASDTKFNTKIQKMFTSGRHSGISIVFLSQHPTLLSTIWRNNFEHLFLFDLVSPQLYSTIKEKMLYGMHKDSKLVTPKDESNFYDTYLKVIRDVKYKCLYVCKDQNVIGIVN